MKYTGTMDPEVITLCDALNRFPGIETTESCCGHGRSPYRIWFYAENLEVLPPLLYFFDSCHGTGQGWSVQAITDCAMSPVHFMIEGPIGGDAALTIADNINIYLNRSPERILKIKTNLEKK